ncbi:hypothetical protein [Hymenobacter latericus]|uniref:hypothetical protein n=1 Tax=Hymenobacter sp. YIM 151858-1 TaxID=2987688 RepID=UPI002225CDC8|nr:hypothetical protein [Hymenobacter sp. YIM 151858-1]UYZ60914.1 hypothetical protein OIS50_08940 [Hymenobacter sp. YIM 151858-1]
MSRFVAATPPIQPLVLGVALTIPRHERARTMRTGVSARSIKLRIDPALDLLFVSEVTLPSNLDCLAALTSPNVVAVSLRTASLELLPEAPCTGPHRGPTLNALSSGHCFVTAHDRKAHIASFGERQVRPDRIDMQVQGHINLLEYLRADWFTVEVSGTHRRRLSRPLPLRLQLTFDVQELTHSNPPLAA